MNVIPIDQYDFPLNKQKFVDAVRRWYNLATVKLPAHCPLTKNSISNFKNYVFVTLHHNKLCDITAVLLNEVCHGDTTELIFSYAADKFLLPSSNKKKVEAKLDIRWSSLWIKGQKAFFDIRIFDPSALKQCHQTMLHIRPT